MKKKLSKKSLFLLTNSIFIIVLAVKILNGFFYIASFHFSIDSLLNGAMSNEIKKTVKESSTSSLINHAQTIQKEYPFLASIILEHMADKSLVVTCTSVSPLVKLSNNTVLMKNGIIIAQSCLIPEALEALPQVKINTPEEDKLFLFSQWLLTIPDYIFKNYSIAWCNDYEIYLIDKQNPKQKCICSIETSINQKVIEICQSIFRGKVPGMQGMACHCTADIRFEKQIIICLHKGGTRNG